MNILFVCRYNRFRSRVAEAVFKKLNKNPSIKVKSAGAILGSYPLDKSEVEEAKKFGISIEGKPQALSEEILDWYDTAIIVAEDVPANLLNKDNDTKQKVEVWKISDEKMGNNEQIKKIIKKIENKVKIFVKEVSR